MEVAILFDRVDISCDVFLYRPISVVKGKYDKRNNLFSTEYGDILYPIDGNNIRSKKLFSFPSSMPDLRKYFGNLSNPELTSKFLEMCSDTCYLGYYDSSKRKVSVAKIPLDKIEDYFRNGQVEYKSFGSGAKDIDVESAVHDFEKKVNKRYSSNKPVKLQKRPATGVVNLPDLRRHILSTIVAQDEAVRTITTTIAMNYKTSNPDLKSHILIMGPTGVGKSSIIKLICNYLSVPFCKVDSTNYTQTGYVGNSVEDIVKKLIVASNYDIDLAQKGIIVIDEIDKKASIDSDRDISTTAVQESLLKLTGRDFVEVEYVQNGVKKKIDFDTSNITVVFTGAFSGIEKFNKNHKKSSIGFISDNKDDNSEADIVESLKQYGIIPELLGRIGKIVTLKELSADDFVLVLDRSDKSPIIINQGFFENDMGIEVSFTSDFVAAAAKKAEDLALGVRGLNTVVNTALDPAKESILEGNNKVKCLTFTGKTIINPNEYYSK